MARPSQLAAVTLVYGFGVAIALARGFPPAWDALLWGYAALMPVAASIHYANEYADLETDRLTERTPFSGGSGALPKTDLPRRVALVAAWGGLVVGGGIALSGFASGILPSVAGGVLLLGAFFGWMYSLRPMALAWRGWGELDNAALGGVLLPVYGYVVLSGRVDVSAVLAVTPFALLVFANLLATTWPDRKADAAVGKFTLATRWPIQRLRFLYWATAAGAFVLLPLLVDWVLPEVVAWACLLAVPMVMWGAAAYTRVHSPFPTVAAMIVMLFAHALAWLAVLGLS